MTKQDAIAAATVTQSEMDNDRDYSGMIRTQTYYGRGFVPSNAEMIGNVLASYRYAKILAGNNPVVLVIDEDAAWAVPGLYDTDRPEADENWTKEDRISFVDEYGAGEAVSEDQALTLWWDLYARYDEIEPFMDDDAENTPDLREDIAKITNLSVDELEDYDG